MCSNTEPRDGGRLRAAVTVMAVAGGLIGYALLAHWGATSRFGPLGVALATGPVFLLVAFVTVRTWGIAGFAVLAGVVAVIGVAAMRYPVLHPGMLLPVPSIGVNLFLCWFFAHTLRPGRHAIVTRMARHVHGSLPAEIEAHTRHVTWAWSVFFAVMAAVSLLLFVFATREAWSLFANLLMLPLAVLMFVGEYVYRIVRFPNFSHASLMTGVRAFRNIKRGFLLNER